jgi:putative oligomerization/nucleic acid binding protein
MTTPALIVRFGPTLVAWAPHIGHFLLPLGEGVVSRFKRRIDVVEEPVDLFEEIERFGKLRDAGYLTEEEFSAEKAKILDRI